jgi:hypothetical protein
MGWSFTEKSRRQSNYGELCLRFPKSNEDIEDLDIRDKEMDVTKVSETKHSLREDCVERTEMEGCCFRGMPPDQENCCPLEVNITVLLSIRSQYNCAAVQ